MASDISKRKFHLIVEEHDREVLSHNETKNIRKFLKGGNFMFLNIIVLAQPLMNYLY